MALAIFPFTGWSRLGLRGRLILAAGLALVGATILLQGFASHRAAVEFEQDMRREAEVVLNALSVGVAQYAATRNSEEIRDLLAESAKSPLIHRLTWVDETGQERIEQAGMASQEEVPAWFRSWVHLPEIRQARSVEFAGHSFGKVEAQFNSAYLEGRLWRQIKQQIWMTGLLVAILMMVITLVLHANLAILGRLSTLARRFMAGEYDVRETQNPRLSPEVRELLGSLNDIADNIEHTLRTLGRERRNLGEQLHFQKSLLDAIPLAVFYKSPSGVYQGANRAWERFFDRDIDGMIGKTVADLYVQHPDIARIHAEKDRELWRSNGMQTYAIDIPDSKGAPRHTVYSKAIYHQADGNIGGIIGVIDDVSSLRQAEAVNQRFGRILDQSLNEIYVFDAVTLKFTQVNLGARRNLRYSLAEMLSMTPLDIKPAYGREQFEALLEPLRRGRQEVLRFETVHRRRDGTDYQVQITLQLSQNETPPVFLAVVEDITDKKYAEQALRESEERFRGMAGNVPGMVFQATSRQDGLVFHYASDGSIDLCGRMPSSLLEDARNFLDLIHADDLPGFLSGMAKSMRDLTVWHWEGRIRFLNRQSSDVKWINWRASPRLQEDMLLWDGVASNITEAKLSQQALAKSREQLQDLSDHLQTVREEEKSHIAREIHDELGGTLTALKMDTYWLSKKLPDEFDPLHAKLSDMLVLVDGAVQTTRRICTELRPTVLDDLGLIAAIEWQLNEFQKRMSISCDFRRAVQDVDLENHVAIALFRILQESLTNIARHAGATSVRVEFQMTDQHVSLRVEDNGKGLDPSVLEVGQSHGLRGIRERARQIGGQVRIAGTPGKGTVVEVRLPLSAAFDKQGRERQI